MRQALGFDMFVRLLAAVDDRMICSAATAHFGIAPSTAIRWHAKRQDGGNVAVKPQGWRQVVASGKELASDFLAT